MYVKDFGKNEVALARYLRGVGFKALQRESADGLSTEEGTQRKDFSTQTEP